MDTAWWIVIAAVVAVIVVVLVLAMRTRNRRHHLQGRFGPEYDRALSNDKRRAAERDLSHREKEHDRLEITPLSEAARERYAVQWNHVQAEFVDHPESVVGRADDLVRQVMRERGYPVDDFDQQASLVSVDYPGIVDDYRTAHGIAMKSEHSTEDLRVAVVRYRSLFEALLERDEGEMRVGRR